MDHAVAAPPRRSGAARFFHPLVEGRTYRETLHLLLDLVVGVFCASARYSS